MSRVRAKACGPKDPFAHFVSGCAQTAECDWAGALAVAPGGQRLGRQSLSPGQLQALLDAGSSGGGEEILFPGMGLGSQLLPWRNSEKRGSSLLPLSPAPPPPLFQCLDLSSLSMTQALARTVLERLPWSLNVAPNLHAPNILGELSDCWLTLGLCDSMSWPVCQL